MDEFHGGLGFALIGCRWQNPKIDYADWG